MSARKQTKGRQKITMKRIENEDDRLITFSKRRSGIYKKASELVTLCGAEVGVLVFSPAGKPFSFGHPSLDSIANRFLGNNPPPSDSTHPLVEAHWKMRINELNQQHNEVLSRLEAEKERGNMLKQMVRGKGKQSWWDAPIDELNMEELQQMIAMMQELHSKLCKKINGSSSCSSSALPHHPAAGLIMSNPSFAFNNANGDDGSSSSFPHGYG